MKDLLNYYEIITQFAFMRLNYQTFKRVDKGKSVTSYLSQFYYIFFSHNNVHRRNDDLWLLRRHEWTDRRTYVGDKNRKDI